MRGKIFIIVFSLLWSDLAFGQTVEETYRFAEKQYEQSNYESALTEYQRVAFFDNSYQDVYLKIANSFYFLKDYEKALQLFDIAYTAEDSDSIRREIIFSKSMCYLESEQFLMALNELLTLPDVLSEYFYAKKNLYIAISYYGIGDYLNASSFFQKILPNEAIKQVELIFYDFEKYRKRFNPDKVQLMSILLPGLGQLYCGDFGSAANSVILIGTIAIITARIWNVFSLTDALVSMSSWYYRYYNGGNKNAERIAINKIEEKKEECFQNILTVVENNIK